MPVGPILSFGTLKSYDHPINDIVGARSVGMRTAWLHRGKPWPADAGREPDLALGSLAELLPTLAQKEKTP